MSQKDKNWKLEKPKKRLINFYKSIKQKGSRLLRELNSFISMPAINPKKKNSPF